MRHLGTMCAEGFQGLNREPGGALELKPLQPIANSLKELDIDLVREKDGADERERGESREVVRIVVQNIIVDATAELQLDGSKEGAKLGNTFQAIGGDLGTVVER